jgi:hypothetical protein
LSGVWKVGEDVAWVHGDDRVALLDLAKPGQLPVVLTDSSAAIWSAINGLRSDHEIVALVAALFEVNEEQIGEQVSAFLGDLASRGLIVRT